MEHFKLTVKCPTCGVNLVIPDRKDAHRVVCPHCSHVVPLPGRATDDAAPVDWDSMPDTIFQWYRDLFYTPDGLATAGLLLAFLSVPLLCIPFYGSIIGITLSVMGLGLTIAGLVQAYRHRNDAEENTSSPPRVLQVGKWKVSVMVVGVVVPLATLGLALLPLLHGY